MEQKRVLTFPNGREVLPHIINYLKIVGVDVRPKDNTLNRSEAIFNMDGVELTPKSTSQGGWWLQTPDSIPDEHTVIVNDNEISYETSRHDHVYLGILEEFKNGFSIITKHSGIDTNTKARTTVISSVIVSVDQMGVIRIQIKSPKDKKPRYLAIGARGEIASGYVDACYYMYKLREAYENKENKDSDDELFIAMLKDHRLYKRLAEYLKGIPSDLGKSYEREIKEFNKERDEEIREISKAFEIKARSLDKAYKSAIDISKAANGDNLGMVKIKHL